MPKFRYRARSGNSDTEKVGYLDAPSAKAAKAHLEKKGFQIAWFGEVPELTIPPASGELALDPSKSTVYGKDYDVGEYRPGLGDFLHVHKPSKQAFRIFMGLCSVLGVLVLFATWGYSGESARTKSSKRVHYKLQVVGKIDSTSAVDSPRVTLSIPEIPYQQTWQGADAVDDDGEIKIELEILTRRHAGQCNVELSVPGHKSIRRDGLSLSGFDSTLDLGTLTFEEFSSEVSDERVHWQEDG